LHRLCGYSRNTNTGLVRSARDLIDGHLDPNAILGLGPVRQTQPRTSWQTEDFIRGESRGAAGESAYA
jgi:hypothetical protein